MNALQRVRKLFPFVVLSGLCCITQPAQAVNYTWDCTSNSFWDITTCWGPDGLPTSSDFVFINTPYTVTIDGITGNAYASRIYIGGSGSLNQTAGTLTDAFEFIGYGGNGTYLQSGGTHTVTSSLYIGYTGTDTGTYTQTGGTLNAATVYIGTADSKGVANVSNSTWNITSNAYIGSTSATGYGGSLGVGSGGTVNVGGNLTVFRPSINNAKVGEVATTGGGIIKVSGSMTLQGGKAYSGWGAVDSGGAIFASDMITANGVTVGGAGSLWSTGTLIAGRNGTGTLTINADGKVTSNSTYIAEYGGSTGNIVIGGNNALLQTAGTVYVGGGSGGSGGAGHLTVNSGGKATAGSLTVLNGSSNITTGTTASSTGGIIDIAGALTLQGGGDATGYIGYVDNSYSGNNSGIYAGSASISGTGTRWDTAYFYTGYTGSGTTTVASGGTLASVYNTYVGWTNGSNGTLNVNAGGTVDTNYNAGVGVFTGSIGTVTVGGSSALWDVANGLWVGESGTATVNVNSGGTVASGSTIYIGLNNGGNGTLNVNAGGTLDTNVNAWVGYNPGSTGTVNVSGSNAFWDITGHAYVGGGSATANASGTLALSAGGKARVGGNLYVWGNNASVTTGPLNTTAGGTLDILGTLSVQTGGQVTSYYGIVDSVATAGTPTIAAHAADISGTGSRWETTTFTTGYYGTGTTTVSGGGTLSSLGNTTIGLGSISFYSSTGTLNVNAGGTVDTNGSGYLGYNSGSTGNATVGGTNALWDIGSNLYVGLSGTGNLTVNSGGTVATTYHTYTGNGIINVNAGGTLDTNGNGYLATSSSTGSATVGGTGALWDVTGGLYLGGTTIAASGIGTLTVNSGGTVKAGSLTVWNGSSSIKTGTTTSSTGGIIDIAGALTLQGGGDATGFNGYVDDTYSSTASGIYTGSANISGSGSRWDTAFFHTGYDGNGTTTVASGGTVASTGTTLIGVNNGANGALNVNAGGTVDTNSAAYMGYYSGSTGTVTVGGTGALWDVAGGLYAGINGGTGILTVNSGGTVNAGGLTVYNGSSSIKTGSTGTGTGGIIDIAGALTLQGGGDATSYQGFVDSSYSNTQSAIYAGSASITGTGSRWDTAYVHTGYSSTGTTTVASGGTLASVYSTYVGTLSGSDGTLNVNAGGKVDTKGAGYLGTNAGATGAATVGGTGALWDVKSSLLVGLNGTGTLTVNSGGTVASFYDIQMGNASGANGTLKVNAGGTVDTNRDGYLGNSAGATGTATVGGSGALWDVANALYVGGSASGSGGTGTLTVTTGGTVSAGGAFKLWDTGVLNMNGGTLNAGLLDTFGAFNFNAGTVNVTNNLTTNGFGAPGSIAVGKFDTLAVGGTTTLNDYSTLDINGGIFSTGALVDNGGFAFNSGTFNLTNSNLVIGASGLFGNNVEFDSTRKVNVTNNLIVDAGAVLGVNNTVVSAGIWNNNGTVDLVGSVGAANGGSFNNNSLLTGNGIVGASLVNNAGGEVRATLGDTLTFNGASNSNSGNINLLGGTAKFDQGLTNNTGAFISGHGALIATGGLTNDGTLATTAVTDIQGDVTNNASGHIVIAGTTTTFYDDVVHNGAEFKVNNGAQAVFFGSYTGAGNFTGTGELVFAGDLMPGNSPALIDVEGDLTLWGSSSTIMEIAGMARGSEYDAFNIGGNLTLAGTLDVAWFDIGGGLFNAGLGDTFDLFSAENINGAFDQLVLALLDPGLAWQLDYLTDFSGTTDLVRLSVVSAVPVPAAVWLFGSGVVLLFGFAKRRSLRA